MRKPHKHAELIKAWAEGAEIEQRSKSERLVVFNGNEWEDFDGYWFNDNEVEYRIKPEPKPDVIALGIIEWNGTKTGGMAQYNTEFRVSERYEEDNVKLTFDGETGKLKSAEVI